MGGERLFYFGCGLAVCMIRVGIVGGSGYTGGELLRLLAGHPGVEVVAVTSRSKRGLEVGEVHPHLRGFFDLVLEDLGMEEVARRSDVVFTAVPHGSAMEIVPRLLEGGVRVIDLSADYRLESSVFERVYGLLHVDRGREAVYGLTELHPEVSSAVLVANPGCYPTGAVLAVAPLVGRGVVERVVFDSKSGISGAGNNPSAFSHYPNMAGNVQAYRLTSHRHLAEMTQELNRLYDGGVSVSFTPHVIPSVRGILTTAHVFTREPLEGGEVGEIYQGFYRGRPFIRITPGIPGLSQVRGSNFCDIGFEVGEDRVVVVSAIDNLVKGASGQAIQNMNLMFGLSEKTGLWVPGLAP